MKKLGGAALAAVAIVLLAGCSSPAPAPTVTVIGEAEPAPTVTVTVTASPEAVASQPAKDRLAALRTVSERVTGVDETEPGRWTVHTSLVDPGAGQSGSADAQQAVAVCKKAVELGATYVVVRDSDGSSWVLYGHPSYGNSCTEV